MEDVAVYGYVTPLRVKIILALALTDAVVRDVDVIAVRMPPRRFSTLLTLSLLLYQRSFAEPCTRHTASRSPIRSSR